MFFSAANLLSTAFSPALCYNQKTGGDCNASHLCRRFALLQLLCQLFSSAGNGISHAHALPDSTLPAQCSAGQFLCTDHPPTAPALGSQPTDSTGNSCWHERAALLWAFSPNHAATNHLVFCCSMLFAGFLMVLQQSTNSHRIFLGNQCFYLQLSLPVCIFCTLLAYGILRLWHAVRMRCRHTDVPYRVYIRIGSETRIQTGLADTGNNLVDPYSGLPIIVCSRQAFSDLLPQCQKNSGTTTMFLWDSIRHKFDAGFSGG